MTVRRGLRIIFLLGAVCGSSTRGQEDGVAKANPASGGSAAQLVREGNELLLSEKAQLALDKYKQAKTLAPDAREIAFAEGLSHFQLGDYGRARERFAHVAASGDDALADDALYSRGTCDHAEALAAVQNPSQAIGKLESAMRRYREVLSRNPTHNAARDANLKAASMWRQINQQMQQKQEGENNRPTENPDEQQDQPQPEEEQGQPSQSHQDEDEQAQPDSPTQPDQPQESQAPSQEQSTTDEHQPLKEQQEHQQAQEEEVSREQAERKLREMLEALKDRRKVRPQRTQRVPPPRGGKDW